MRFLIKYTKNSEIKFISHLDLMRTIQRVIRRAELDVEFSQGFNPHMALSIAQPLAVGVYSSGDYMDLVLKDDMAESELINALNSNSPDGVIFIDAVKVYKIESKKDIQSMAAIDAAQYTIKFESNDIRNAISQMESLIKRDTWEILKTTKKSENIVDIKEYIKKLEFLQEDNYLVVKALISCGSRENLSPRLLGDFIIKNIDCIIDNGFIYIKREEMYVFDDTKYKTLRQYFKDEYSLE